MDDKKPDRMQEIMERGLRTEGWVPKCKTCGKTPENVGWCDECGYNRDYELVETDSRH